MKIKKELLGCFNKKEAYKELISNDFNWYVVEYIDGSYDVKHRTGLSSILECGVDPEKFDMVEIYQCWNGQELGECPF
jgi:hypothetical protein